MKKIIVSLGLLLVCVNSLYAQCDSAEIERIDEIRRMVANSLIDASSVEAMLDDGTELMAFYVDAKLVKMSVSGDTSDEIYFEDGQVVNYEVSVNLFGQEVLLQHYFKDGMLMCSEESINGEQFERDEEMEKELNEK